jgi:hypothetical protein
MLTAESEWSLLSSCTTGKKTVNQGLGRQATPCPHARQDLEGATAPRQHQREFKHAAHQVNCITHPSSSLHTHTPCRPTPLQMTLSGRQTQRAAAPPLLIPTSPCYVCNSQDLVLDKCPYCQMMQVVQLASPDSHARVTWI